jgi:hypothetical protein
MLVAVLGISPTIVFAQGDGTGRFEERKDEGTKPAVNQLDATAVACIKAAVVKREDALIAGFDIYAAALKAARQVRKDSLSAAWDKTVPLERRAAVKAADKAFAESTKAARKTWNDARRSAWRTFDTDRKACNASGVATADTGSSVTDAAL